MAQKASSAVCFRYICWRSGTVYLFSVYLIQAYFVANLFPKTSLLVPAVPPCLHPSAWLWQPLDVLTTINDQRVCTCTKFLAESSKFEYLAQNTRGCQCNTFSTPLSFQCWNSITSDVISNYCLNHSIPDVHVTGPLYLASFELCTIQVAKFSLHQVFPVYGILDIVNVTDYNMSGRNIN